jgi:hypothetical protein
VLIHRIPCAPLLYYDPADGHAIIQCSRRHFIGYSGQQRNPDIPPVTEVQVEVLDTVHYLAHKSLSGAEPQKGDIQYIKGLGLLHARDVFKDSPEHMLV